MSTAVTSPSDLRTASLPLTGTPTDGSLAPAPAPTPPAPGSASAPGDRRTALTEFTHGATTSTGR